MKRTSLIAVLATLATMAAVSQDASARGRIYHPRLGRFMQRDPIGTPYAPPVTVSARPTITRNVSSPRFTQRDPEPGAQYTDGMNIYQYVQGRPLTARDPSGLLPGWWVAKDRHYSGTKGNGSFTASLWENTQGQAKSTCVLAVKLKVKFVFGDGKHGQKFTQGGWAQTDRDKFIKDWKQMVKSAWHLKYKIVTKPEGDSKCKCCKGTDVAIDFAASTIVDVTDTEKAPAIKPAYDEWLIFVLKGRGQSSAERPTSFLFQGAVAVQQDGQPVAAHEFGHMLGLPDEYKKPPVFGLSYAYAKAWVNDKDSIMNVGAAVRPRHYVSFSEWMDRYTPGKCKYAVKDAQGNLWDTGASKLDLWMANRWLGK